MPKSGNNFYVNFSDNSCLHPSGLFDKLLVMADHKGDRKGRPYRRVPTMTPVACTPGDRTGDPVGAPLAGAPDDTAGKGL
jgi:hypothetical protein